MQVTGGKWTTYRKMAEDVMDALEAGGGLPHASRGCVTPGLRLLGARDYKATTHAEVGGGGGGSCTRCRGHLAC